jgi:hypothetical protein
MEMDLTRVVAAAGFLTKLMRERIDEAKRLMAAGEREECKTLLAEVDLLKDAFDCMDIHNR